MESTNPALYENGQYLRERDGDKYTEPAIKAQAAKLARLMKNRSPRDTLRRSELASSGNEPPLYHFGFPYKKSYAVNYARRHHLTLDLVEEDREAFGGKEVLDFADLDESEFAEEDSAFMWTSLAVTLMTEHLGRRCGFFSLRHGSPFTLDWDGIISLWSNYDVEARWQSCYSYEKVVKILGAAMNEEGGQGSKAQWWFDKQNDVGVFISID